MPRGKRSASALSRRVLLSAGLAAGVSATLAACAADAGPSATAFRSTHLTLSRSSGSLRGGTAVTASGGRELSAVRRVLVGGAEASLGGASGDRIGFTTPAVRDFVAGSVPVVLQDGHGGVVSRSTFRYVAVDGIDRQLAYMLKYWKHYNPAWDALPDDDCVDFTSQGLLQRGWRQQGDWTHASDVLDSGIAWRGSTAFMTFMTEHPSLGTALTDQQREKVKVGDVVQFDWDRSGDRDHTGVVSRVTTTGGRTEVYFAGHTIDSDYRSVDDAITKDHPGGVAYYWSLT